MKLSFCSHVARSLNVVIVSSPPKCVYFELLISVTKMLLFYSSVSFKMPNFKLNRKTDNAGFSQDQLCIFIYFIHLHVYKTNNVGIVFQCVKIMMK